jgi:hypothetical protein
MLLPGSLLMLGRVARLACSLVKLLRRLYVLLLLLGCGVRRLLRVPCCAILLLRRDPRRVILRHDASPEAPQERDVLAIAGHS